MLSMSKHFRPFLMTFAAAVLILQFSYKSAAQDIEATLRVDPERSIIHVEGRYLNAAKIPPKPLVFLSDYAGIPLPKERIRNIKTDGQTWSYEIDATPMSSPAAMAHISWFVKDRGVLMLGDLLPRTTSKRGVVRLDLPADWRFVNLETPNGDTKSFNCDLEKGVFHVGPSLGTLSDEDLVLVLSISDGWQSAGVEVVNMASEVLREYKKIFPGPVEPMIRLAKPLSSVSPDAWYADTRGAYITVVSSEMPFASQSIQRLHEQLRHEMFHLWIPEGVNLTGHYDWFYEGFALYQSLKLGVAVNRIRFDDYLDTLSRAYDIDRRLGGKMSLIDASTDRWRSDNNTVIYARGMLVAFLCDLALMNGSKGKVSSDYILRQVYSKYSGSAASRDGNEAVIEILKAHKEIVSIIENYVTGIQPLDWDGLIKTAGLQAETKSGVTTLAVISKPGGSQKRILDKLGYNNWRKLLKK